MSTHRELLRTRPRPSPAEYVEDQRFFNVTGGEYETVFDQALRYNIQRFLLLIRAREGAIDSFLDAGCREGRGLGFAKAAFGGETALTGVDIVPQFIDTIPSALGADCRVADISALPFPDRAFDAVFCSQALEHTDAPHATLTELARVADKYLFVGVPIEDANVLEASHYTISTTIFGWMVLFEAVLNEGWSVGDFWRNIEAPYLNVTFYRKTS